MKKVLFLMLLISSNVMADEIDEMKTDLMFAKSRVALYAELQEREPSEYHALLSSTTKEVARLLEKVYNTSIIVNTEPKKKIAIEYEIAKKEHVKAIAKSCKVKKLCVDVFGEGSIEEAEREAEIAGAKVSRLAIILKEK